jgi:hypothetical protein
MYILIIMELIIDPNELTIRTSCKLHPHSFESLPKFPNTRSPIQELYSVLPVWTLYEDPINQPCFQPV